MQGKNQIILNPATMEKAIQYWFTSQFRPETCPKVNGVSWNGSQFVVQVDGQVATMTPAKVADAIR